MFLGSQKPVEKEILKQAREKDVKIHLLLKQLQYVYTQYQWTALTAGDFK
jgi:hypothetical protein